MTRLSKNILFDKRAITPLMITMLLVSFAVAVGSGVMKFGRAQVEERAECAIEIKMNLASISGQEQLCYNAAAKRLSFTAENGININIDGLIVSVIGAQKAETFELNEATMTKAGSYVGNLPYDLATSGQIRQVKLTPKISGTEGELICAEQALTVEKVPAC